MSDSWFAIFGEGEEFIKILLNSFLGILVGVIIAVYVFSSILIKLKIVATDDDDTRKKLSSSLKKNVVGLIVTVCMGTIIMTVVNVIPQPDNTDSAGTFFDAWGENKDMVLEAFNWTLSILYALLLVTLVLSEIAYGIQFAGADNDQKNLIFQKMIKNGGWFVISLFVVLIVTTLANVVPIGTEVF